jgi:hypothetical protein
MKTTDLFRFNRSAERINESLEKNFGAKINFQDFDTAKLEDARNKLRTQIHDARSQSGFNETLENPTLSKAQFMHDAIVAELAEREEYIVDTTTDENYESMWADPDMEEAVTMERDRDSEDWDEGNSEPPNNFAVSINGKQWKVFKGRGRHADDAAEQNHFRQLQDWARKKSEATGKKWTVHVTGEPATESIEQESAPPTAKGERMVKHIKKGYANDGKITPKEKSIAYATAWKQHNKEKNESVTTGDDMARLQEGEIQQASAIVTAKTMVDRVGRWIEELSGMENDTLLQLGDSIRDEMGQEQSKAFIQAVAPAIQQALETLKGTRDTLSTGVRSLASGEQPADMLGAEPTDMGGDEMAAEPDAMNMGDEIGGEDEFAAAEPAAGGLGDAGREQRESIDRSNSLLRALAG